MSRYRKIDPRVWNDEKFRSLSDDAQLIFFYLLTHPYQTSLGAMRASVPGLAAEKGWRWPRFKRAFNKILALEMARHDSNASFIWLPNFLKYNGPESPNVVKSWGQSLDLLPECKLKRELIGHVKEALEALPKAFREALPEVFTKSMPNKEQEQDNKTGAKAPESSSNKAKRKLARPAPVAFEQFYGAYPRHVNKQAALKAWAKLNPDDELTGQILKAVESQKADGCLSGELKFIPHPASWLNGGRWEDESTGGNGHAKPRGLQEIPAP